MASRIGKNISVSIFGQSHSVGIGCVVEGIPAGKKIDLDELQDVSFASSARRHAMVDPPQRS